MTDLDHAIGEVVAEGNCSGCGACGLLSQRVQMQLDGEGFVRPRLRAGDPTTEDVPGASELFARVCPGRVVPAPARSAYTHESLGPYESAWEGWAVDPEIRFAGSSGGVLTALAAWLLETGRVHVVAGAAPGARRSTTVPVRITSREEALASSGSRYGPVGVASTVELDSRAAMIAKPCEASAIRQLAATKSPEERPLILSFFCAGTPSQHATDSLAAQLGASTDELSSLRYRGNGWPGRFVARTRDGREFSTSYEESWGAHLGRDLQWRCKVCVDGVGDHADIAVGDYWYASSDGYPEFEDEPGRSVVIARSRRGDELLKLARDEGVIVLQPIDLDAVASVQPLQVERRQMLAARLAGRALSGRAVPRYPGYRLVRRSLATPIRALRNLIGTFRRSLRARGSR